MFVGNKKKVMDTLIDECTQKKLAKSSNLFIWVYLSGMTEEQCKQLAIGKETLIGRVGTPEKVIHIVVYIQY